MSEQTNTKVILLIDDATNLLQLTKIALKSKKYQVETAKNGIEGLAMLEKIKPDLIILDLNMPQMDGLEFYRRICYGGSQPQYPVLLLTARSNVEQLTQEINIDGFMVKPFEIADLLRKVDSVFQKKSNTDVKP